MSREIYISSTPQETRLAIVEKDELSEIYYERENEYTLAGSIYNGKVTRVLPGMQSAFVDIGLERDAFLYITDFMEEAGDSADFESAEGRSRGRGDRGDRHDRSKPRKDEDATENAEASSSEEPAGDTSRDRGGDRNRGRRDGRHEPRRASPAHEEETVGEAAPKSETGDSESTSADGSRKWRGRRGRRRGGRNGSEEARTEAQPQRATTSSETSWEEPEPAMLHASASPVQGESERRPHRDRGDRGGRGDRNHRDSRPSREDRPRRDEGVDLQASAVEPFILPGESLSKYRAGGDAGMESQAPFASKANTPTSAVKPSTEFVIDAAWDGGSMLPGESLSRHRNREEAAPQSTREQSTFSENRGGGRDRRRERDQHRGGSRQLSPAEAVQPAVTSQHEPEPTVLPLTDDAPDFEVAATEHRLEIEEHFTAEPAYEPQTDLAPQETHEPSVEVLEAVEEFHETVSEYEPGDNASASYRVDPAGPREFRQDAPVLEEEFAAVRFDENSGTGDAVPPHEFTNVQTTGEMISEAPLVSEAEADAHDAEAAVAPIAHETAVESGSLSQAEVVTMPGTFAPGDGELEEELLDEDDSDLPVLHACAFDDTEEETLENAADLGTMIREMSIDHITRPEPDGGEHEEDDFDIDEEEMEEDELESDGEEGDAFGDHEVSEGDEEFAEPSDHEDSESEHPVAAEGAPEREGSEGRPSGRRDNNRRGRDRNNRDRRSGGGSHARNGGGRPGRHSVQATDLPAISDLLKPGQEVLVQIAKEPIAKKGARITSHIALPGRFLVFMPTVNHVGVSRKIESDGERRRLKEVLLSEKGEASGGFIVRTAAMGASEEELRSDLRFLLNLWTDIKQRSEGSKSPALIYHDLNLVERVLRDQVSDNFSAIWVDTEAEYERVLRFLQRFQPSLLRRVKLYTKDTPLFEQFGITSEINKALRSKVWLKSGGSIVINQTEALVAIDINTGKFVGKTARLEDTIVKTNLDAIPEIVRQIRLRDLGGIIIIDFIDMDERKNRQKVMIALEEELKKDRAPSKVLQFNDFGLVAITRKRVKQSLERTLSTTCGVCTGTGMVKSPVTVCNEIYVELRKMQKQFDKGDVMLRVNPEVVKQLKTNNGKWLQEMEEISGKTILVKSDPALHPEQFDIH